MKIKVTTVLKNYENKDMMIFDGEGKETPLTVRSAISLALNTPILVNDRPKPTTAEDKAKIYQLCTKLFSKKEVDFTVDDRAFIKKRAGQVGAINALVHGRLREVLEDKKTSKNK